MKLIILSIVLIIYLNHVAGIDSFKGRNVHPNTKFLSNINSIPGGWDKMDFNFARMLLNLIEKKIFKQTFLDYFGEIYLVSGIVDAYEKLLYDYEFDITFQYVNSDCLFNKKKCNYLRCNVRLFKQRDESEVNLQNNVYCRPDPYY